MVVADREVGDDPDLGGQPLDDVGAEVLGVARQDGLGATRALDELVARVEPVVGIEPRVVVALQSSLHGGGQLPGHKNGLFRAHLG